HGQTWYYLGQFYFDTGTAGKVVLTNESTEIGQAIIADAVRFGGGVGTEVDCDVAASVGTSGFPRFEEGAQMYAPFMGYGTCNGDVSIRPNYAEWELSKGTAAEQNNSGTNDWNSVYVSWHTNAGGGQGTSSFIYEPGTPSQNDNAGTPTNCDGSAGGAASGYLRNYIHDQVITDIHADWDPMWTDRGKKCAYFGEISNNLSTMPGVLLEMGFHDNMGDATAITTPDFRQLEARAVYKGLVQFFNHYDNTIPLVYAPEQATHLVAKNSGAGQITLTWDAPPTGGVQGDAATTYKVYTSTHGKGFADGVSVSGTTHTITGLLPNTVYYFRVAGMNTGGESIPTSVVAAKTPPSGGTTDVLIVDGFDRLERSQMIQRTTDTALGNLYRGFLDKMNAYTYQVEHARSICECGAFGFDGATNEAVMDNDIALGGYKIVDWFVGEESTGDDTFDATEQAAIIAYLDAGGNIITSGAEIGWDLGRTGISSAADVAFYNNYLKSTYAGDGAGTYFYSGTTGEIFDGNSDSFDDGTTTYDVNFPDRLGASTGATIVLNYSGGTGDGAAVGYDDPSGFGVVNFGFPLETVANQSARTDLICNSINFLDPTLLSVEGLELAGDAERGVNVLNWKTLTEENTDYFVLEKSKDGFTFMEVGKVDAAGLSLEPRKYSLRDKTPYNKTYYRVKLFDFDGTKHYSNVIVLGQEGTLQVNVFPNPTKSNLINININSRNTQGGDFQLFDIAGRLVHQEIFTQNTNQITIQNLAKGAYHYVIMSEGKQAQG
ncbi:MAG: T9SS type A sorting domain-containing protein, partial [Saprospiraceae bacterium]